MIADFLVLTESITAFPIPSNLLGTTRECQNADLHGNGLVISPKTLDLKANTESKFLCTLWKNCSPDFYQFCGEATYINSTDGNKLANTTIPA